MNKFIEMSGMVFGKLTVIERLESNKNGVMVWKCICECGNFTETDGVTLRRNQAKSCGCNRGKTQKHGYSVTKKRTPEYNAWAAMILRCKNPKAAGYKDYGGRGIVVCDKWELFKNFIEDMGDRPSRGYSLDRIDVDGNYEPSNCRWATGSEQGINKRLLQRNTSGVQGVSWSLHRKKWLAYIGFNGQQIQLGYYDDKDLAIEARKTAELKYYGKSS